VTGIRQWVVTAVIAWLLAISHPPLARAGAQGAPRDLAPPVVLQQIGALISRDDIAGAKAAIRGALADHPNDPALHNFAGVVDAQANEVASAEAHFRAAIRLAPRSTAAYENLGRLYQEHAAADPALRPKALDTYRRLLAVEPTNAEGLYQAGFLLTLDGKFAEGRALLERLPADVRRQPQILTVLVLDLAGIGDTPAATALLHGLAVAPELSAPDVLAVMPAFDRLTDDQVPQRLLEALDQRGLAPAAALQRLAQIHARHERYREARAVLERAVSIGGATVPLLVDLARVTDKLPDHQEALGYLAHARDLEPANANVHFLFGIVCVELNLGSEAYESLKKAVALAPDAPLVNYAMGAVSMHRHEPSESLPYLEKYIALVPDDPRGRFALGVARFYSSQFEAAAADLREAARHHQTAAGAHYFLGKLARQSNDLETARREVEESVRLQPAHADAWAELGLIQTRTGNYAEAERALGQAIKLDADNYSAAVNLGVLYGRTKDPRREAQATRLAALQEKRTAQAQEFLRMIEVVR
jgi:tetratricopeptide (TPR) repeat protein